MNDLDARLDSAAHALLRACRELPAKPSTPPTPGRRVRLAVAAAAGVAAVVAVAVIAVQTRGGDSRSVATDVTAPRGEAGFPRSSDGVAISTEGAIGDGGLAVFYEKAEMSITYDLQCSDPIEPEFSSAVYESWSDRAGKRWRTTITYPDGSTFDLVYTGSVLYPDQASSLGVVRGDVAGCRPAEGEPLTIGSLPGNYFLSLNIGDEVADDEQAYYGGDIDDSGGKLVGPATDSRRRSTTLWRTAWGDGASTSFGDVSLPLTQSTEWYVDDESAVVEYRFIYTIEGLGTATSKTSMIERGIADVEESLFDVTGWVPQQRWPKPRRPCPAIEPATEGPLTVRIEIEGDECPSEVRGTLLVTNDGPVGCESDRTVEIGTATGIALIIRPATSESPERWSIAPRDYQPPGMVDYPPGTTSWPLLLEQVYAASTVIQLPTIACGGESFDISLTFG